MSESNILMLYFVTVNYNSKKLIKSLIDSIANGITSNYQVLIVNNSPQEKDVHRLESDRVKIIESGENIGFGRACNLGIDYVWQNDRSSLVWLINPDTTLDSKADKYIEHCFRESPNIAILGTQIRTTSGEIWFTTGTFNRWTGALKHHSSPTKSPRSDRLTTSSQWVTGCSMILNLEQFKNCPAFDPNYFLYSEDTDFCIRYAQQGYLVAVTQKILVTHQVSSIIGRSQAFRYEHYTFSRLYFLKKNSTWIGFSIYLLYSLISQFILLFIDFQNARGRWRGVIEFLRH